jgi:glycosyltransferase involved in cell wall biosynthesis
MEYAALGIPSIAARTQATAAYFDETTVQFFTPGDVEELADCILRLYHDRDRLATLARNIVKFNEQYNWPDQRANYLQLVDQLLEHKG